MNGVGEETSIKQLFQKMTGGEVQLIKGTVTCASPLSISTDDDKLTLNANITIVPEHLTDYEIEVSIEESYNWKTQKKEGGGGYALFAEHDHDIVIKKQKMKVHGALKEGDKVHILSLDHGKNYYVLDRVG